MRKMKTILVYRWKAYNYVDVIAGFQSLGYDVDEIYHTMESYDEDEEMAEILHSSLRKKSYDFVFTMNYFPVISDVC